MPENDPIKLLNPMTDEEWTAHMAEWSRYQRWVFLAALVTMVCLLRGPDFIARRLGLRQK